jgi:hypothetical protein
LDLPFTEEEVKAMVMSAPTEKALGPDGFIGLFFSHYWEIAKHDIMKAIDQFYVVN